MANHQHVEVLVDGVDGIGPRRVRRRGQHVGLAAGLDDVGSMTAPGAFGVVGVDAPALERVEGVFDEPRFVQGIRVNGVAPGPIWTPLQVSGGATQEKLKSFGEATPLGRPGQPAELASIYVQLAANDASFSTGQIYGATGGSGNP